MFDAFLHDLLSGCRQVFQFMESFRPKRHVELDAVLTVQAGIRIRRIGQRHIDQVHNLLVDAVGVIFIQQAGPGSHGTLDGRKTLHVIRPHDIEQIDKRFHRTAVHSLGYGLAKTFL